MKSEVFKTAWTFFREQAFGSFGECLRAAWQRVKLVASLRRGLSYFSFRKANGDVREAIGTLHPDNYTYTHKSRGERRQPSLTVVRYWDVERRAFRSLRITNFIGFQAA